MTEPQTLSPATLGFAGDGTPWSEAYGDVYHSADGGPGQSGHVFLAGNGLPQRWGGRESFVILETGFGTGLNFLTTWATWRDDPRACGTLHYLSVEKHPFRADDLARLHARWPALASLAERLRDAWPVLTPGFHRLEFEGGRLRLTLMLGDAEWALARLSARVDAIFLDGFAPPRNPAMWSPSLFRGLARLAGPRATLATWSVAAEVRDGLTAAGFRLDKRPGYGRKREMLTGVIEAARGSCPAAPERRALVIGAGLAGSAVCNRLAQRGWEVTLIERHNAPAREASGNLAGIVRPLLSLDDNIASRFTRAAFLHTTRRWGELDVLGHGPRWQPCGALQIARNAPHAAHQRELVHARGFPTEYVSFLDREAARQRTGWPLELGGWYFPGGGWAQPPSVCETELAACGPTLDRLYGKEVHRLERIDGEWQAWDGDGRILASAPHAVLAGGARCGLSEPLAGIPLRRVRGQVTHIPAASLPPLRLALCREGYASPALDGWVCVGASYDFDDEPRPRPEADRGNLQRLERMLPGAAAALDGIALAGRVGFRSVAPDRLPLAGALPMPAISGLDREMRLRDVPRHEGLYGLMGLASRGLVWALLAAELLAARMAGEPLPLESDLADALDPARFLLRRLRRGRFEV